MHWIIYTLFAYLRIEYDSRGPICPSLFDYPPSFGVPFALAQRISDPVLSRNNRIRNGIAIDLSSFVFSLSLFLFLVLFISLSTSSRLHRLTENARRGERPAPAGTVYKSTLSRRVRASNVSRFFTLIRIVPRRPFVFRAIHRARTSR